MEKETIDGDVTDFLQDFEVAETSRYIVNNGFLKVALQFPDHLLHHSPSVAASLKAQCERDVGGNLLREEDEDSESVSPQVSTSGTTGGVARAEVQFFVLADTTYGSCCVDEVAAAHVAADCVIHYGHTCMSPTTRLPVRFVHRRAAIDVADCALQLLNHSRAVRRPLLITYGLEYSHAADSLSEALGPYLSHPSQDEAMDGDTPSSLATSIFVARTVSSEMHPIRPTDGASCQSPAPCGGDGPCEGYTCHPAGDDKQLSTSCRNEGVGSMSPKHGPEEDRGERGGGGEEFLSGGLKWTLPKGVRMEDCMVAWIGEEGPALTSLVLCHNSCTFVRYDADEKRLVPNLQGQSKTLMRRYYLVEKAKDANIVGIVVGTLGVGGYLSAIRGLRKMIKDAGKKSYTFVMGKPNPAKLANFPECEVFVLVACPQTALLDSKDYLAPVITPFEAELAFVRGKAWTGSYRLDFSMVAEDAGGEDPREGDPGNAKAGCSEATEPEEEEEPRFSLISGGYIRSGAPDLTTTSSEANGERTNSSTELVAVHRVTDMAAVSGTAMGMPAKTEAHTAAEYLTLCRTYKGLSMQGSHGGEPTPVVKAVVGRTGRAAGYKDEG